MSTRDPRSVPRSSRWWSSSLPDQLLLRDELPAPVAQPPDFLRQRYTAHLNHLPLQFHGYLPNLEPLLRDRSYSFTYGSKMDAASPTINDMRAALLSPSSVEDRSSIIDGIGKEGGSENTPGAASPASKEIFGPGSVKGSIFNLASSTLGAGALALPFAIKSCGLVLGLVFMALAAWVTVYTINLLIKAREGSRLKTYEDLSVVLFGKRMGMFCEINIIIFCFGAAISYIVGIGDIIVPLAQKFLADGPLHFLTSRPLVLVAYTVCVNLPLSLMESINQLRFTSVLGVCSIIFLVIAVTIRSIGRLIEWSPTPSEFFGSVVLVSSDWGGIFRSISMIMFAFSCQPNVYSIYSDLVNPTPTRMNKVAVRSNGMCMLVYVLISVFGYIMFLDDIQGNILQNFEKIVINDPLIALAEVAMTFSLVLAFPLNIFPCRYSIDVLLFHNRPYSRVRTVLITLFTVAAALGIAVVVPGINVVFELLGGTASAFVCFILPGAFILKLSSQPITHNLGPLALVVGGALAGLLATSCTILNWFS
eukprot:GILI01010359.1.p1 GENE.GILI01010359.1~~GILI01010359.1.p1  ORF type:complete len:534 (-),score=143.64 GILI01010359.1:524-2125(-)